MFTNHTAAAFSPLLHPSKRIIFPILQLPRELRDLIYSYAIADGTVEILGTNKRINKEASPLVLKYGVLRVNLGFVHLPRLDLAPISSIQHLDLRLRMRLGHPPCRFDLISGFFDKHAKRGSCEMIFDLGNDPSDPAIFDDIDSFDQLAKLAGFQSTTVRLLADFEKSKDIERVLFKGVLEKYLPYDFQMFMRYY